MQGQLLIDLGFRLVVHADDAFGAMVAENGDYRFAINRPYIADHAKR